MNAEHADCRSAAVGHLYVPSSEAPISRFAASAGRLACSYTAEFTALLGSLTKFSSLIPDGAQLLIATDSQSLLQALAKGPLLTEEDFEDQLWALLLTLSRRGCQVTMQFFYSHVDFPPRNEAVDAEVSQLLEEEDDTLNHDSPAIWHTDVVRAVHRHLYLRWLDNVDDARTTLCGKTRAPLRTMAAWPRADQILLSRSRTDTLPELGTYRLRLGIGTSPACRWCGLTPPMSATTPTPPQPSHSPPPPPRPHRSQQRSPPPTHRCPRYIHQHGQARRLQHRNTPAPTASSSTSTPPRSAATLTGSTPRTLGRSTPQPTPARVEPPSPPPEAEASTREPAHSVSNWTHLSLPSRPQLHGV